MIAHNYTWPREKVFLALDNIKCNTGAPPHSILEAAGDGPLAKTSFSNNAQEDACEDAIGRAYAHGDPTCQQARQEAGQIVHRGDCGRGGVEAKDY